MELQYLLPLGRYLSAHEKQVTGFPGMGIACLFVVVKEFLHVVGKKGPFRFLFFQCQTLPPYTPLRANTEDYSVARLW